MTSRVAGVLRLVAPSLIIATTGCAALVPAPAARGVPGFDTRAYPGDEVMHTWREHSPYQWVGYYLEAPCHVGSTWMGLRGALERMGWGIAVLYVGEQDWRAVARPPRGPGVTPPDAAPRCTPENLTPEKGAADAADAESLALAEGFGDGAVIYLNVERKDEISAELRAYVAAWAGTLLDRGRVVPGLYVHEHNTEELRAVVLAEFERRGRADRPRLWVARSRGFDIRAAPAEAGIPDVVIWQGLFDVRESWGGATLQIDVNVADSPYPSM